MSSREGVAIRIATWPPPDIGHPYVDLLYEALASHGVERVHGVAVPTVGPSRTEPPIDVWHLHWADTLWRAKGDTFVRQVVRIARLQVLIRRLRRVGVRIVWTAGDAREGEIGAADRVGFRMLHRIADLRIFPSTIARAQALARYGDRGDSIVVPPGACPRLPDVATRAEIRRAMGIPPTCRALLFVGDLRRASGCDIALNALDHLRAGEYRLVIGGRAIPPFGNAFVRAAEARRGVHLVASQLDAQHLDDLLYAADVVLFPARSVTESSGPLRALSRGRGVVTADLPYFRELLEGASDACAFASPNDAEDLARAIERLLDVPFERREECALRAAADRSWERSVAPFADWLDRQFGRDAASSVASAGARPPRASGRAASSARVSR